MTKFFGRFQELSTLETAYQSDRAEFIVLYGRRRIGKTSLLSKFCYGKPSLYFSAKQINDKIQLKDFSRRVIEAGAPLGRYVSSFETWDVAFEQCSALSTDKEKFVLILDEFPYMAEGNKSIASVLQHLWDHQLSRKNIMIVLCGSSMSFMEKEVLGEKSPLYGRATHTIKLGPMRYTEAMEFFPNYSTCDKILSYAVLGGSPYCLSCFDDHRSFKKNVIETILRPSGRLWDYPATLIHQECREPSRYNDILTAVACGATRFSELVSKTGIVSANLPRFLNNLEIMGFIRREFSIDTPVKKKSVRQRGLYRLGDPFVSFWYRYVWSNLDFLTMGGAEQLWKQLIEPQLNELASFPFEDMCRQYLWTQNVKNGLPFLASHIGRWWNKSSEIDLLALSFDGHSGLLGECKFKNSPMVLKDYLALKQKAEVLHFDKKYFMLFSLSGFSPELKQLAQNPRERLCLVEANELVPIHKESNDE